MTLVGMLFLQAAAWDGSQLKTSLSVWIIKNFGIADMFPSDFDLV
jgi:hypothetical protein